MIPTAVKQTTNTPVKSQRRHQDPLWLWIAVLTGSMVLHLLAFLLLRSSGEFKPWFPQTNQGAIAIDLIELDPEAESTTKSLPRESKISQPATQNQDDKKINPDLSLVDKSKINPVLASKPTTTNPTVVQPTPTPTQPAVKEPTTSPSPKPTPTQPPVRKTSNPASPIPTPQTPPGELPWQSNRQDIKYGKGKLLSGDLPANLRNSTTENPQTTNPTSAPGNQEDPLAKQDNNPNPQPSGETSPAPNPENSPAKQDNNPNPQPSGETSPAPNPENSPAKQDDNPNPQSASRLIAGWQFLTPQEQRVKVSRDTPKDLILPQYIGSKEPEISIPGNGNQDLPQGKFLVSLVIDRSGKLVNAEFVGSNLPPQDKQKVVNLAKEIFQGEPFEPQRYSDDKTPPEFSNLLVWLTIKPNNSP